MITSLCFHVFVYPCCLKTWYKSKTGETPVKKDTHADAIGAILRLPENDIESLTKANKNALKVIFEALANSKPI